MRLLLDANISFRLVERLADVFPDSSHVSLVGLERADDGNTWEFARNNGYVIVSKDEDFHQLALVEEPPPKLVWVRLGNCSTADVERVLREGAHTIEMFVADEETTFLVLE